MVYALILKSFYSKKKNENLDVEENSYRIQRIYENILGSPVYLPN